MNLFDVTRGHNPHIGPRDKGKRNDGPRQANQAEIKAYLLWIAARRGIEVPRDAEFFPCGITSASQGAVMDMPGYGESAPTVTFETLGDDGEVIASQTLPVEPKKGGVIWDKAAVHKACGPIPKPAKVKATRKATAEPEAPIVDEAPERPVERVEEACAPRVAPEPVEALGWPDLAPDEVIEVPETEWVVDPCRYDDYRTTVEPDPLEALSARLAALEARVAALPVDTVQAPTVDEVRPRRSAAHDWAVRRAWAARADRRGLKGYAELLGRQVQKSCEERDAVQEELQAQNAYAQRLEGKLIAAEKHQRGLAEQLKRMGDKRRRAVIRARDLGKRLQAEHRLVDRYQAKRREAEENAREWSRKEEGQRRRADVATAALAKLRADLADPGQPERASDIARLVQERDAARTAASATDARNRALQGAVDGLAERFEAMVSRVTRAEAAMRAAGLAVEGVTRVA